MVGTCFFDGSCASGIVGLGAVLRLPLLGAGRALGQLPFVLEQVVEEVVAPLRRRLRPGDFRAAGDGVGADAGAVLALPAEALVLDARAPSGSGPTQRRIAGAVGLAEGVAAGDQRDGLLVVHRHAGEGLADVLGRGDRIRLAVRAFRIDVDQAHLHGAERILRARVRRCSARRRATCPPGPSRVSSGSQTSARPPPKPKVLKPIDSSATLPARTIRSAQEILLAVFLLDRPQQPARLVEVGVVRPAVQRREALLAGAGAAAAVGDAVGAGAVPGHADEQAAVVAEVGRPPVLRVRHQGMQVLDHRVEVEALEFLGVVERLAHRIGQGGMSVENLEVQLVRPPVPIGEAGVHDRAFAGAFFVCLCVHICLRLCSVFSSGCSAYGLGGVPNLGSPNDYV